MFFFGAFFIIWLLMMLVAIGGLIFYIFYLLLLSRTLELCHPHTRKMNPGEVWMVLIPAFGIVWHFIMIGRIADSLAIEFRNRNLQAEEERPGYQTGLTANILLCCSVVPFLGWITAIVSFVFLIMYYNKIRSYKNRLEQHNAMSGINAFAFQQSQQQHYPSQYPPGNYPPQNRY